MLMIQLILNKIKFSIKLQDNNMKMMYNKDTIGIMIQIHILI